MVEGIAHPPDAALVEGYRWAFYAGAALAVLGALVALMLIRAKADSPKRDYSTVMEVFTAYVRENTPQAPRSSKRSSEVTSKSNDAPAEADEGAKQPTPPEPRRPTADIQAILDVLSRAQTRVPEEYRTRLDLHEANLLGANLQEANLQEANLEKANLQRASLLDTNLRGANLREADLREADLREAIVTDERLAATLSLEGATMPDGRKYEDWRKDKEGSGKDVENENTAGRYY
jgi:hypothetical protein